ncbi:MAG: hypothetical protein HOP30_01860 [Cyclobacteriaceae bacterium]|nr:hypothetical protein [Cyclobacteriaceae bacterium]
MKFERRKELMDHILRLESSFPVDKWIVAGIQFWPILKNQIFLYEFKSERHSKTNAKLSLWKRGMRFVKWKLLIYSYRASLKIKPAQFVFSGAYTHEVKWNGRLINRYFTPMIEYLKQKNTSAVLVSCNRPMGNEAPQDIIEGKMLVDFYKSKISFQEEWQSLLKDEEFKKFIQQVEHYFPSYAKVSQTRLSKALLAINAWKKFYLYLFKQTNPSVAFGLCYYSNEMFGMNMAAKELGIRSIDMQHGTISQLHTAYTFSYLPPTGYHLLPSEFWVWDESTFTYLSRQFASVPSIQVKLSGNPWLIEATNAQVYPQLEALDKPMMIYTHQPLRPPLDNYLLETIAKTKNQYSWWIRLHPRTTEEERKEIQDLLLKYQLVEFVELQAASELPLPTLLSKAAVHLSKFSGSVIESTLMGVPTLILEEVGLRSFDDLIQEGKAIGLLKPESDQIVNCLATLVQSKSNLRQLTSFKDSLDKMIKKDSF